MINIVSLLWEANEHSHEFSRAYSNEWAAKLFNGFRRNLTVPHKFVLFTDMPRNLPKDIKQIVQPDLGTGGYADCVRPFALNEPMILLGLDSLIVGNVDKLARWCLDNPGKLALPKHPYEEYSINGVQLWGGGNPDIYGKWTGQNDMDWIRTFPHERIDELWPGKVVSYRAHVRPDGPGKARIIYFHGRLKFNELLNDPFIKANWR
jgi:hypothetical protein